MRFKDRENAASSLGRLLKNDVKGGDPNEVRVIGIPRGGVIMAAIVGKILNVKYDIVIPRKLRAPYNEELAIGAIIDAENPLVCLDQYLIEQLNVSSKYIESEKQNQIQEIKRRVSLYQTNFKANSLVGKTVIVVDDGAARGATLIVTARWIRKFSPKKLIMAVPVGPKGTIELLKKEADLVQSLISPSDNKFGSVGRFYQNFPPVTDETVIQLMQKNSS